VQRNNLIESDLDYLSRGPWRGASTGSKWWHKSITSHHHLITIRREPLKSRGSRNSLTRGSTLSLSLPLSVSPMRFAPCRKPPSRLPLLLPLLLLSLALSVFSLRLSLPCSFHDRLLHLCEYIPVDKQKQKSIIAVKKSKQLSMKSSIIAVKQKQNSSIIDFDSCSKYNRFSSTTWSLHPTLSLAAPSPKKK
jgi:hypothetical protein